MSDFKLNQLKKVNNFLIVVSMYGEGDLLDNVLLFYEFLYGRWVFKFEDFCFFVLVFGDSLYEFFCQIGKEFDQCLEEFGGKWIFLCVDCDFDYDELVVEWLESVFDGLSEVEGGSVVFVLVEVF